MNDSDIDDRKTLTIFAESIKVDDFTAGSVQAIMNSIIEKYGQFAIVQFNTPDEYSSNEDVFIEVNIQRLENDEEYAARKAREAQNEKSLQNAEARRIARNIEVKKLIQEIDNSSIFSGVFMNEKSRYESGEYVQNGTQRYYLYNDDHRSYICRELGITL